MKRNKYGLYVIVAMAVFAALGTYAFGEGESKQTRMFLSVKKVLDQRQSVDDSCILRPTVKEVSERFAIELDDNVIERKVSRVEEPAEGFYTQLLGVVGEETTFKVTYTYTDGNKVDVMRKMRAWANGEYPEMEFAPAVKFGDDNGPKNVFRIGLEVYADPDSEFVDSVRDALLGIVVVSTSE